MNKKVSKENKELIQHMQRRDTKINEILINFEGDNNPFGEKFSDTVSKIKETSPFRKFVTYSVSLSGYIS